MPSTVNLTLTPMPMQGVAAPGYGAVDLRRFLGIGLREGVMTTTDLKVSQRAGGPGMAVDVAIGYGLVQGDAVALQGLYHVVADSTLTGANELTISPAHATLPRVDSIILDVQDNAYDGSGFNRARVRVLTGTPTAGANRTNRSGAVTLPLTALLLGDVEVAATATTISNANIQDRRPLALLTHGIGEFFFHAGSTPPPGAVEADGAAISRVHYSDLFNAIGTVHGAGDGSTTFAKPNLSGRSPVGVGTSSAAGATPHTLGQLGGEEKHQLVATEAPAHTHPNTIATAASANHVHTFTTGSSNTVDPAHVFAVAGGVSHLLISATIGSGDVPISTADAWHGEQGAHSHAGTSDLGGSHTHTMTGGVTANTGDQPHQNMHPYTGMLPCIYHGNAF